MTNKIEKAMELPSGEDQDLFSSLILRLGEQETKIQILETALIEEKERSDQLIKDLEHAIEQVQRLKSKRTYNPFLSALLSNNQGKYLAQ